MSIAQVTSINQLSDIKPTDWAFQALQSLVERYGCIVGYPNRSFWTSLNFRLAIALSQRPRSLAISIKVDDCNTNKVIAFLTKKNDRPHFQIADRILTQITKLSVAQLEDLGEALFDFDSIV
jgi:hypothetical protein